MAQSSQTDPARSNMLEEVFKAGKEAASHPRPDLAAAEFARQHSDDRELVHEFMRGMRQSKAGIRSYEGILVEHGQAKYNHDPRAKMSYFVTLDTPRGQRTVWGIDLGRAMAMSDTQVGDPVHIAYGGAKVVEVDANVVDGDGKVIGTKKIETPRNEWVVTKVDAAELASRQSGFQTSQTSAGVPSGAPGVMNSLFGSGGLSSLKRMLSFGGERVNARVADFSEQRATLDLQDTLMHAKATVSALNDSGLSVLRDDSLGEEAKAAVIKRFMSDPQNRQQVLQLASQIDKVGELSEVVIGKSGLKGRDEKSIDNQVVKPIRDFKEQNDKLLKSLRVDDRTLYDRLDGILQHLSKFLSELLDRIRGFVGLGTSEKSSPGALL